MLPGGQKILAELRTGGIIGFSFFSFTSWVSIFYVLSNFFLRIFSKAFTGLFSEITIAGFLKGFVEPCI